jgi:hypothetical protein
MLNLVAPTGNYFEALQKFGVNFCFFCSDPCNTRNSAVCIHCGAVMCIATHAGGAGCIGLNTLAVEKSEFESPVCVRSTRTATKVPPYFLAGSGLCQTPKIAWPLLLITIELKNLDSLVLKLVFFTMESNYVGDRDHVRSPQLLDHPLTLL